MNNVLIVGAGNMGEAMLKGWLKANNMLKQVYVREPDPSNCLLYTSPSPRDRG